MKNQKVLLLVIVGLLVVGSGVYVYKNKKAEAPFVAGNDAEQTDTANWKTYENKEGKYSFKYPSDWYLSDDLLETGDRPVFISNKKLNEYSYNAEDISIQIWYTHVVFKDRTLETLSVGLTDIKNFMIDGIKAVRGYALGDSSKPIGMINIMHNSSSYWIHYPYDSKLISTFDEILSTFKFTK